MMRAFSAGSEMGYLGLARELGASLAMEEARWQRVGQKGRLMSPGHGAALPPNACLEAAVFTSAPPAYRRLRLALPCFLLPDPQTESSPLLGKWEQHRHA